NLSIPGSSVGLILKKRMQRETKPGSFAGGLSRRSLRLTLPPARSALLVLLAASLWIAISPRALWAQAAASGTIQGVITDPTGAVVPAATVQVSNVDTNVSTTVQTDASGRYFVPNLRVGTYSVTVTRGGFKTVIRSGIVMQVNQIAEIDITLQLGESSQTITVAAAAPVIETSNATIGQVIDNQQTTALPLNGRSYAQ